MKENKQEENFLVQKLTGILTLAMFPAKSQNIVHICILSTISF